VPLVFLPFPDMAIKGAGFYSEEAAKAGRSVPLGRSIGLARLIYLGDTREQAMERARNGSIFLFRNPEWFMVICDQGFMPIYEIKKQLELFGTKVMPAFMG
jgi:hypothetical protein